MKYVMLWFVRTKIYVNLLAEYHLLYIIVYLQTKNVNIPLDMWNVSRQTLVVSRWCNTLRPLGYERVYLSLWKVADTLFHIQGDYPLELNNHLNYSILYTLDTFKGMRYILLILTSYSIMYTVFTYISRIDIIRNR